jgi:hypothetical protein
MSGGVPVLMNAIRAALRDVGPMTMLELAHHVGRDRRTVYDSARVLKFRCEIHIARYEPTLGHSGRAAPVYARGAGEDAVEPKGQSDTARNRRYRREHAARLKAQMTARRGGAPATPWTGLLR